MPECVRLHIYGQVQGVFYRASVYSTATSLGLTGWGKNHPDGTVEVLAEGKRDSLEKLIQWCQKGPPGAKVTDVKVIWEPQTGRYRNFKINYD